MRCWIAPGERVPARVLRVLLYCDGGGGVVFRRALLRIIVEGAVCGGVSSCGTEGACRGRAGCPWVGGGRSWLSLPGRCPWCRSRCLPRKGRLLVPTHCRPLSSTSTAGGSPGSLGDLGGRMGSIARRPYGGIRCWLVWRRCPLGGGAMGAWRRGLIPFAGVPCSALRWLRGIRDEVAWAGQAHAGLGLAGGRVGAGPWLPVGVGWPRGRRSHRFTGSGLQRTSCRGNRGDGVVVVSRDGVWPGG